MFFKAEEHAIILQGNNLIDVTPQADGETQIVFLPDERVMMPEPDRCCKPGRYHNRKPDDPLVVEYIAVARHDEELKQKSGAAMTNEQVEQKILALEVALWEKYFRKPKHKFTVQPKRRKKGVE